jgi:hypothetical protein
MTEPSRPRTAVTRATRKRAERFGAPTLAVLGALMAYVWALFHCTLQVVLTFRFPESRPHTFEGIADLGTALTAANALWALLIVGALIRAAGGPRHVRRARIVPLVMALVVVAMMQRAAFLLFDIAHW